MSCISNDAACTQLFPDECPLPSSADLCFTQHISWCKGSCECCNKYIGNRPAFAVFTSMQQKLRGQDWQQIYSRRFRAFLLSETVRTAVDKLTPFLPNLLCRGSNSQQLIGTRGERAKGGGGKGVCVGGGGGNTWSGSPARAAMALPSRAGVRRGGREPGPAVAAGGQHGVGCAEAVDGAVLHAQGHHPAAHPLVVHYQVQSKVLHCKRDKLMRGSVARWGAGGEGLQVDRL